jgi:hypothetical protein
VPEIARQRAVRYDSRMTLFTLPFTHPMEFFISLAIGGGFVYIFQKAAMSQEQRETSWVKRFVTGPNSKVLWGALWVGWALVFGLLLGSFEDKTAHSPYGSVGLIALFSGFFLMMGFIWASIGE